MRRTLINHSHCAGRADHQGNLVFRGTAAADVICGTIAEDCSKSCTCKSWPTLSKPTTQNRHLSLTYLGQAVWCQTKVLRKIQIPGDRLLIEEAGCRGHGDTRCNVAKKTQG